MYVGLTTVIYFVAVEGDYICATPVISRISTNQRSMAGWGNHRNNRATTEDMLERENQDMTDQLAGKVSRLKLLALDMELETKDQNRYMNGMDTDFDSATGLLTGSMKRVSHMVGAAGSNRRLMCYLILGLVGVFVLVYYILLSFRR